METLSEANYHLALDLPSAQVPDQSGENPPQDHSQNQNSLLLYQNHYSARDEEDMPTLQDFVLASKSKENQESTELFEVDMDSYRFQFELFIKSFFLHFLYLTGIGLLLLGIFWCCWPKFIRNHYRYTDQFNIGFFTVGGLIFIFTLMKDNGNLDLKFSLIHHIQMMLISSFACAAIESYCNDKFLYILKNVELTSATFEKSRFRLDTFYKIENRKLEKDTSFNKIKYDLLKRKATEEEIKIAKDEHEKSWNEQRESRFRGTIINSISKLNIDISVFYLAFFDKTPQNLLRVTIDKNKFNFEQVQNQIIGFSKLPKSELLTAITSFEIDLFDYRYFTERNKHDKEKAHAYMLAVDLLRRVDKSHRNFGWINMCLLYILSVVTLVLSINYPRDELESWVFVVVPFSIQPFYYCLLYFVYKAVDLMKSKCTYMEELEQLMFTTKKNDGKERTYPILNFLDFMSMKSWTSLRKIFMHLNNDKLKGTILAVSIILVIQLLTLAVIALFYFKVLKSEDDYKKLFIIFTMNAFVFLATLFLLIFYAAKVNVQFQEHKNLIRSIKQTAAMLFKLYPDFVGENAVKPGTYIYNMGLKYLRKEFGDDLSTQVKEKLKEREKTLMENFDSILEELDYEEANYPIRILGLPITMNVVKAFAALLISIATPLLNQGWIYISYLANKNSQT